MTHRAALAIVLLAAHGAAAQPRDAERAVLPGLVIDAATAPRDASGGLDDARIRGARAPQPMTVTAANRRAALAAQRDAAGATAAGASFVAIPPLPGDVRAPARIDAGDADPDRLHSPAPPPER